MSDSSANTTQRSYSLNEGDTSNFDLACKVCTFHLIIIMINNNNYYNSSVLVSFNMHIV